MLALHAFLAVPALPVFVGDGNKCRGNRRARGPLRQRHQAHRERGRL